MDYSSYDTVIVFFSGGKDSTAAVLAILEEGCPAEKIELWHHDIDGREGSRLMDWPITRSYCQAFADAFGLPIYFSWRQGGFEQEMLRKETATGPVTFEDKNHNLVTVGGKGPAGTRLKFPQVSADLKVRWCSAYLKIDVGAAAIANQSRFTGKRTLVVTGERGEESAGRAKYKEFEPHRTNCQKRHVDHYRPVLRWQEERVWEIIEFYQVRVHPAYYLGFGRVSCMFCIFGNADQFITAMVLAPERFKALAEYEDKFGVTIKRKDPLYTLTTKGTVYPALAQHPELSQISIGEEFNLNIIMADWYLPAGAYGESCGPV